MNTLKNTKTILYIILAVVILLALGYGVNQYFSNKKSTKLSLQDIMALDEEERKVALENQIKDLKNQAESLGENAEANAKFAILIRLAEAQIAIGKYDDAISTLNSIPEEKKTTTRTPIAYARAYKGKGDIALAKENIQKALNLDSELPEAVILNLELNQDLPKEQLETLYRNAIAITKSNVEVMISYAKFCERIGDKATAIAAWETAINVDPEKEEEYRAEIARLKQ